MPLQFTVCHTLPTRTLNGSSSPRHHQPRNECGAGTFVVWVDASTPTSVHERRALLQQRRRVWRRAARPRAAAASPPPPSMFARAGFVYVDANSDTEEDDHDDDDDDDDADADDDANDDDDERDNIVRSSITADNASSGDGNVRKRRARDDANTYSIVVKQEDESVRHIVTSTLWPHTHAPQRTSNTAATIGMAPDKSTIEY